MKCVMNQLPASGWLAALKMPPLELFSAQTPLPRSGVFLAALACNKLGREHHCAFGLSCDRFK